MIGEECPGCGALAERVEQPQVEELQPGIEPLALKRFSRLYWKVTKQATSAHEKASSSRNSRLW